MKSFNFKTSRKSRRGVGGIIAGVILMAIIFTSVLVFFVTINNNEKARLGYEIAAQEEERKKATERYSVVSKTVSDSNSLDFRISNDGPIPMTASQLLVYCADGDSCSNPSLPQVSSLNKLTLNAGEESSVQSIAVQPNHKYRIEVISERGNIVATSCEVEEDLDLCREDAEDGLSEDEVEGIFAEGITQGTGSLQLDFKSYGAIYPTLVDRDGVNQQGWLVNASRVDGYPGFTLKEGLQTIIVERMRNLDSSGQSMILDRSTALVTNPGGTPGEGPEPNYICTRSGNSAIAYDGNQVLPPADPTDRDDGFQVVYFCSVDQGLTTAWAPNSKFGFINPVFMILRSQFENSNVDYGQTVPYQSFTMSRAFTGSNGWYVCLANSDVAVSNSNNCDLPASAATKSYYRYKGDPGTDVWVHFNSASAGGAGTAPYKIDWIYPGGSHRSITYTTDANGNLRFQVPTMMADDTTSIVRDTHYIIKISDSSISDQGPRVMFMTFQVT